MPHHQEEVYLLGRDAQESARLNIQHRFLVDLIGSSPIHPSIPNQDHITAIADLGTGTGIWLKDTSTYLQQQSQSHSHSQTHSQSPTKNKKNLYLHGFDISSAQFPSQQSTKATTTPTSSSIHLSVQDILKPFPKEHRGRYDLVHLRLLVGALKEREFAAVVRNAWELLKPGGHLQWDDCDTTAFSTTHPTPLEHEMTQVIAHAVSVLGLSPLAPVVIQNEAMRAGFEDVRREAYSAAEKPALAGPAREWLVSVLRSLLPGSMLKSGEVEREADAVERTGALLGEFERHVSGALPLVNLQVVVARKPLFQLQHANL